MPATSPIGFLVEFIARCKRTEKTLWTSGIHPRHISSLVNLIDRGMITKRMAKRLADEMLLQPEIDSAEIAAENPDYQPLYDVPEIEELVKKVLHDHQQSVVDYQTGREMAFTFLVGQVMKLSQGKASPAIVNQLLKIQITKLS